MAANAINLPNPTEKCTTKAEHYKCVRCDGAGYTSLLVQEQLDMIWKLQYDYEKIYLENSEMTVKLRSMNEEMEEFLQNIPLGNILPEEEKVCDVEESLSKTYAEVKIDVRKEDQHSTWKKKEGEMQLQEIQQQKKVISDLLSIHHRVPEMLWGHKSRSWPRSSKRKPPSRSSQKSSKPTSSQTSSRPFSIPFCPKPLHLLARRAYLKPPPKLPPLSTHFTSNAHPATSSTLSLKCSSLECDDNGDWAMEMFANALERAINTEEAAHPYYDGSEEDEHETPWADHPYYDDLEISETGQGDDELVRSQDTTDHEDPKDDVDSEATQELPAFEDHPCYDTPDVGEDHHAESVSQGEDDASNNTHEELACENHPYYDTSYDGEDHHAESVAQEEDEDQSSFTTDEEEKLA